MVRCVGAYELPTQLVVTPDCLGASFSINIAGTDIVATMPGVAWSGDHPDIVAPEVATQLPSGRGPGIVLRGRNSAFDWGTIGSYKGSDVLSAAVGSLALRFELPRQALTFAGSRSGFGAPGGPDVEALFASVDGYFDSLLTWISLAVRQDTEYHFPLRSLEGVGEGLTICALAPGGQISTPRSTTAMVLNDQKQELLDAATLQSAANLASHGDLPHDAHVFMRGAWIELRRGRTRKAVVDAAAGVEMILAGWNARNGNLTNPNGHMTLGWYVGQLGAPIPPATRQDLVVVRNGVIHDHVTPTMAEAMRAVVVADTIVKQLEPLPV